MFMRPLTGLSLILLTTSPIYTYGNPIISTSNTTATNAESAEASLSDLKVSIAQISSDPPEIEATVENANPSKAYTILRWDSPLDRQAVLTGVYEVINIETGKVVRGSSVKPRRRVPAPRRTLVEIQPGETKVQSYVVGESKYKLKDGGRYELRARGTWKAVWPGAKADVTEEEVKQMGRGERALSAAFKSNVITVET